MVAGVFITFLHAGCDTCTLHLGQGEYKTFLSILRQEGVPLAACDFLYHKHVGESKLPMSTNPADIDQPSFLNTDGLDKEMTRKLQRA
mmetsp:Transcript_3257/g.5820  ORF Transcript_3257/g.5820 Transcript_3257/m.5820 type:complete len:88 (-) Transcript_3257:761-1024(-)